MSDKPRDIEILTQIVPFIPNGLEIEHTILHTYEEQKFTETRKLNALSRLGIDQNTAYLKVSQYIKNNIKGKNVELKIEFNNFLKTLKFEYNELDEMHQISDLDYLNGDDIIPGNWLSELGQVSIIQFWTSWCGYSLTEMQAIVQLMEQTVEWEGKVKFIAISMDDEQEHWKRRINEENLQNKMQHYRFIRGWDEEGPVLRALNLEELPYILIINKYRKITYRGHPKDTDITTFVNEILVQEQVVQQEIQQQEQVDDDQPALLLDETVFTELKSKLEGTLTEQMQVHDLSGGNFKVEMIQKNKILHDGDVQVIPIQRTPILINYELNIDLKQQALEVVDILNNTINEEHLIYQKCIIKDSKEDLKQSLKDMFNQHQIDIIYKENKITTYTYNAESDSFETQEEIEQGAEVKKKHQGNQQKKNLSEFNKVMEEINPFLNDLGSWELEEFAAKFINDVKKEFQLGIGDKFEKIEKYDGMDKKEMHRIVHSKNSVLVVLYWSQYDYDSVQAVKDCVETIKKMKWNQKNKQIKLIALCAETREDCETGLDEFSQEVQAACEFCFPQSYETLDKEMYNVQDWPHYIIVDQQGIISQNGRQVNFQQVVTQLLDKKQWKPHNKEHIEQISKAQQDQLQQFLASDQFKGMLNVLGDHYVFSLNIRLSEVTTQDKLSVCEYPQIDYSIREVKMPILQQFLNLLFAIVPEIHTKIIPDLTKTFDVPFPGKNCSICKKALTKDMAQYYNPFTNVFICADCAEYDDKTKIGLARYKCQDTLIFINPPLNDMSVLKDIDEHKKGKNLKIAADDEGSQHHDMCCNGCSDNSEGPRYIAVSCRPGKLRSGGYVDFCAVCFEKLKDKESEGARQIIQNNAGEFLTSDCLFTRILFNHSYYEF